MKLLYIGTNEDGPYLDKFARLPILQGVQVSVSRNPTIWSSADIALLARGVGATAVVCANAHILSLLLESQFDYIKPNTRRGVTLDDYAGSILDIPAIPNFTKDMECLVLNPPKQLQTVAYGPFVFERYLSKIVKPEGWYPQTKFDWKLYDPMVEDVSAVVDILATADLIAVDIETAVGDEERRINCVGYCAYWRSANRSICVVIPFTSWAGVCTVRKINGNKVAKIFQNGLYDNTYFARWNCPVSNWLWDTQHLFHSWLSELPKRLDFIAAFSVRKIRYWKDDGKSGSLDDYYRYNALDCWATLNTLLGVVKDIPEWGVKNYLIEFPLVFPCLHCGLEGFKVDEERMKEAGQEADKELQRDLARLRFIISEPEFNPGSPLQTLKLFKVLGLSLDSTDKAAMLKAKASSTFNERILDFVTSYREKAKLLSLQLDLEKIWNGRLFYSLNPAATDTGRLASKESAFWCGYQIQNVTRGSAVKQCLVADEGWELVEVDKSQSEARCVGYLSGETKLIGLVESGKDYHSWNAQEFFGIPYEVIWDVKKNKVILKEIRDLSKRTNHGANYNMGANVMLDTMGPKNVLQAKIFLKLRVSMRLKDVCQFLLDRYSATYPRVKGLYYQSIIKRITLSGMLVSPLGWSRKFFGKPAQNKQDLNAAVAHEPQNLSVGIVNREFFRIWESSVYGKLRGRYRLKAQIHDSILGQYRSGDNEVPRLIKEEFMNTTVVVKGVDNVERKMFIPSEAAYGGTRWSELK